MLKNNIAIDTTIINGTISITGVSQVISDSKERIGIALINTSQENLFYNFGAPASSSGGSFVLAPNEIYESALSNPPLDSVNVFGSAGQTYSFMEW